MSRLLIFILIAAFLYTNVGNASSLRIATFNVSIEADNYKADGKSEQSLNNDNVIEFLGSGQSKQMANIAEIIQRVRPDIILLNEFDYIPDSSKGISAFKRNYLEVGQQGVKAIKYTYHYIAPVNTGLASNFDLNNDGKNTGKGADAFGYGNYPGQYGMAILSRFPIKADQVRTFQQFKWHHMPNALRPDDWYTDEEWQNLRLSSKSHWDVPIQTPDGTVHIIASHPTPPIFDGVEDRNGKRNHDEIRLLTDYINNADYIYDDHGIAGGIGQNVFVVLGDLNASPNEGSSIRTAISALLDHPKINSRCTPISQGGKEHRPDNLFASQHTAAWGLRVDYVLPSKYGLTVTNCGVFWPQKGDPLRRLVINRSASSDHRLVWLDINLSMTK